MQGCVCTCVHDVEEGGPREGNGGKMRKTVIHLAKPSPHVTFHAVCDVIIGDGIWLLHVKIDHQRKFILVNIKIRVGVVCGQITTICFLSHSQEYYLRLYKDLFMVIAYLYFLL